MSNGLTGTSDAGIAVQGNTKTGIGVLGSADIDGTGVSGTSTSGTGVIGTSDSGYGVAATSNTGSAVTAQSSSGVGVQSISVSGPAVVGWSGAGFGVHGISNTGTGVVGISSSADSVPAVSGIHQTGNGPGVSGVSYETSGKVFGVGVRGEGDIGVAVKGRFFAGHFYGNVRVDGSVEVLDTLTVHGTKAFKIDHPLDPANKYLLHAAVEAPDMTTIYNGNVDTDGNGDATVILPVYFEALNADFRYQLTVIGQFAQAIVAREIHQNRFAIKTDKPNVKVSWQVTGIRQDPYAKANPMAAEQDKPAAERGSYLHPELYGQPADKKWPLARHPAAGLGPR